MRQVNLTERLSETRMRLDRHSQGVVEPRPKFLQLTRKETRLREDQYAELSALTRSLMRDRVSRRERITENTLIRVAIDLLLAHRGRLRGSDEDELRRSVTSGVPDFRSPQATDFESTDASGTGSPAVQGSRTARVPESRSLEDPRTGNSAPLAASNRGEASWRA